MAERPTGSPSGPPRRRSISLRWVIVVLYALVAAGIGIWALVQVHHGQSSDHVLSVAASLAGAVIVAILFLVAIVDAIAALGHELPFIDVLPRVGARPRIGPDALIGYAIPLGIVIGFKIWQ